jgi:MFS family permease
MSISLDAPEHTVVTRRRQALAVCLITIFMTLLDMSIVNLTLPQIERSLHLSPADTTLMLAGNALVFGLFLVPSGRLGDMYGRRRLLLIGLWLFAATAVACAVAPVAWVMVASRLIRGAASGLIAPQGMGIVQRMVDGPRRGRVFGYLGAIVGMSTAIGPLLSGALIELFGADAGWRLAFWVTVPVVLVALFMGYRSLPADPPRGQSHRLDVVGTVLLTVALVFVMLPILQMSGRGSHPRWWLLGVGAVLLVLFAVWERWVDRRGGEPVISMSLLRVRTFTAGTIVVTAFFAGFASVFVVMAMFLQQGLKYSALHAAILMLIFTAGSALAAIVGGRLAYRYGQWLVPVGAVVAAIGVGSMAVVAHGVQASNAASALAVPLFVGGIGSGLFISSNQFRSLQNVRHRHGGVAYGVYETAQRISTAVGTAIATALYFHAIGTRGAGTRMPDSGGAVQSSASGGAQAGTAGGGATHNHPGGPLQHSPGGFTHHNPGALPQNPGGGTVQHSVGSGGAANNGAGALMHNGGGVAPHGTGTALLNGAHNAITMGLTAPAIFLGVAAVIALIDALWPRRPEPGPAAQEELEIAGAGRGARPH